MKRRRLYIGITLVLLLLIVGLIGWSIFVGRQQRALQEPTQDLGFLGGGSGGGGSQGGLFGGVFSNPDGSEDDVPVIREGVEPVLRRLYNLPIAGYNPQQTADIRFVDKATGHVFEKALPNESSVRIDQTTIPQLLRAYMVQNGGAVIRQYIDDIGSVVSVFKRVQTDTAEPILLPLGVDDIAIDPSTNGSRIAYIQEHQTGADVFIADADNSNPVKVWGSALKEWTLSWTQPTHITLTQAATYDAPGVSYRIALDTNAVSLITPTQRGLTTIDSPDGTYTLMGRIENGQPVLSLKTNGTNTNATVGLLTLTEKCTWGRTSAVFYCAVPNTLPDASLPDAWYKGRVRFSDSLFKIDTDSLIIERIINPSQAEGVSLDMSDLSVSADGGTVFFANKADLTLWSVTLPTVTTDPSEDDNDTPTL